MDSILTSIKKVLGITEDYTQFDPDLILYINTVIATLGQIMSSPVPSLVITDKTAIWSDLLDGDARLEFVKTYIALKVRLLFDPPQTATMFEAMSKMASELEWRIQVETDPEIVPVSPTDTLID